MDHRTRLQLPTSHQTAAAHVPKALQAVWGTPLLTAAPRPLPPPSQVAAAYMPEVLQAVRGARQRFAMHRLYSGPLKGLLAWSEKVGAAPVCWCRRGGVARRGCTAHTSMCRATCACARLCGRPLKGLLAWSAEEVGAPACL